MADHPVGLSVIACHFKAEISSNDCIALLKDNADLTEAQYKTLARVGQDFGVCVQPCNTCAVWFALAPWHPCAHCATAAQAGDGSLDSKIVLYGDLFRQFGEELALAVVVLEEAEETLADQAPAATSGACNRGQQSAEANSQQGMQGQASAAVASQPALIDAQVGAWSYPQAVVHG